MNEVWTKEYWEQGFTIIRGAFSKSEISMLSEYFDEILVLAAALTTTTKKGLAEYRVIPIHGKPTLKFAKWAASIHNGLNDFRTSPKLLSIVQTLLGPNLCQITNQMHFKNPGDGVSFQMHQDCTFRKPDSAYRDLYHTFLQTAIAVDPSTEENGCLKLVPTSHLEKKSLLEGGYEGWEANESNEKILARLPSAKNGLMNPGDVLVWNPYTIHGSQPNLSKHSRRVYINGFARTTHCTHGVKVMEAGKLLPLQFGPETLWDVVEER